MTIKTLRAHGVPNTRVAAQLDVTEGAVRYHLRRMAAGATDGRARQRPRAEALHGAIAHWLETHRDRGLNLAALHAHLAEEHGFTGSVRSIQRYVSTRFPRPRRRARRRVETPPGAQAQADWSHHADVLIDDVPRDLFAFHLRLSHSRFEATIWCERKDQVAWLDAHSRAFLRLGGVTATVRVDNERTAISRGAGAWGEVNRVYRRYAQTMRFHVDACPPRAPQAKGKVERGILDRRRNPPPKRNWGSLAELQAWQDAQDEASAKRRRCPATGTTVWEAWLGERPLLSPLPDPVPEPFDLVATRPVHPDCMVAFEGRTYSVPFALMGQTVEVRGCNGRIQILAGARVVAAHPRHTAERIVIDPAHFEGEATETVLPPPPLGRMGRRLQEIAQMPPDERPLDLYAALAEVAR